jgi:hypothetical protein
MDSHQDRNDRRHNNRLSGNRMEAGPEVKKK